MLGSVDCLRTGTREIHLPGGGAERQQHPGCQCAGRCAREHPARERQRQRGLCGDPNGHHERQRADDPQHRQRLSTAGHFRQHRLGERHLLSEDRNRPERRQQLHRHEHPATVERPLRTVCENG